MNSTLIRIIQKTFGQDINSSLYGGFYLLGDDFAKCW